MSPKIEQISSKSVDKAMRAFDKELRGPRGGDLIREMNAKGQLTGGMKDWLKLKHPALYQTIANVDATSSKPPSTNPDFSSYPPGTRYAVIDKNEL